MLSMSRLNSDLRHMPSCLVENVSILVIFNTYTCGKSNKNKKKHAKNGYRLKNLNHDSLSGISII